ncbi:MAG TPA: AI-2E family transporter [Candidatus Methylomirabilis sp.]|nr:AI-2E family transporter [Candidatus Methylomirabilis sp.]
MPEAKPPMMEVFDPKTLRVVWTILAVVSLLVLIYLLTTILFVLVFAVVFAYLLFPLVRLTERVLPGSPRWMAISIVYVALIAGLSTIGALVGPRLARELAALGTMIPEMTEQIQSGRIVGRIFPNWRGAEILDDVVRSHLPEVVGYAQYALTGALRRLSRAWVVILIPVFAFFFLRDAERVASVVTSLIRGDGHQRLSLLIAGDLHSLLAGYIRSLILLCLLTFIVWSAVFLLAGVPYALVLAAVGGTLEFLPVLGPLVAGVVVVAVVVFGGFSHPWLVAVFVLVWRLTQDYVSSPLIMGRGVELHPALVIFGVLAGGEIAGPAGMFLSVPLIAGLRLVWRRLRDLPIEGGTAGASTPRTEAERSEQIGKP